MIPPRSGLIGRPVFPGMVTESGDLVILAVQRRGEDWGRARRPSPPATRLLLQGTWKALDKHLDDPDVLVVDSPEVVRRQAVPMGAGAYGGDRGAAAHGRGPRDRGGALRDRRALVAACAHGAAAAW